MKKSVLIMLVIGSVLIAGCMETEEQKKAMEGGSGGGETEVPGDDTCKIDEPCGENDTGVKKKIAVIETNMGVIEFELFVDKAPITTQNFINLTEKGFYDGVIFHRVIDGFMIQGGDPEGTGMGGPGYTIEDEFHPDLKHDSKGIVSMANAGPNTGGSQFFITVAPTTGLDNKHAVFGKVVKGYDVVEKISKVETGANNRPKEDVVMEKVYIKGSD